RKELDLLETPELSVFDNQLKGSGKREISTTMAFVRLLSTLVKDKHIGERVVPIVPDEARTFGMEGMFRQLGIYSSVGQRYTPQDAGQIMFYKEDQKGQILEEGINEAGAFSAWIAAATSYSTSGYPMVPFYIFYSMFGFQRIGDLAWAAGDSQARGFLIGATAGRTTLNGEGLQHQDGHSHLLASTIPNCVSYDPAYAYELAIIIQDGLRRMYQEGENKFYYITTMNENYQQPEMPQGVEEGIVRGLYSLRRSTRKKGPRVQLMGAGTILREVEAAAVMLEQDYGVAADIWSLTSINELQREGKRVARWNLLHPEDEPRVPYLTEQLEGHDGPVVVATDYMKAHAEQLRQFIPRRYSVLGTDGYGRSDTRERLRRFFEVSREFVVLAALRALVDEGALKPAVVVEAMQALGISPDKIDPTTL
ncbi:MAG TPA: pyruvate dehydrogenase (acetyl-transferring), homodimeric type, partial [Halieaceae bacterium]|nr:pyruvate dehydrogenase (acetyl-transferring), homodimeric type [Halieaceae bacterium]